MAIMSAIRSCGRYADGWLCEVHPDQPWMHHVDEAAAGGIAMPCINPTCRLSWANESIPTRG
jgi:hypothetical protein